MSNGMPQLQWQPLSGRDQEALYWLNTAIIKVQVLPRNNNIEMCRVQTYLIYCNW